jgi:hypothetical protein
VANCGLHVDKLTFSATPSSRHSQNWLIQYFDDPADLARLLAKKYHDFTR